MVMRLPERDQLSLTRQKMLADLCVAFGGRIAEELVFGHEKVTTGAIATSNRPPAWRAPWSRASACPTSLGPIAYAENQEEVFLGHSRVAHPEYLRSHGAEDRLGNPPHHRRVLCQGASEILTDRSERSECAGRGLLEYETLTGDEIVALLKGIPPVRTPYEDPAAAARRGPSVPAAGKPRPAAPGRSSRPSRSRDALIAHVRLRTPCLAAARPETSVRA